MNKNKLLAFFACLLAPCIAYGNVIFPVIISRKHWELIIISLIIEYLYMIQLFKKQYIRVAITTVVANGVSGILGAILLIIPAELLFSLTNMNVIYSNMAIFYMCSVVLNTCIETIFFLLLFSRFITPENGISKKDVWLSVFFANAFSVFIGLIFLETGLIRFLFLAR